MIFKLDTEKTIAKNLTLTDKELNGDIEELIRNYSFAMSSFLRFLLSGLAWVRSGQSS